MRCPGCKFHNKSRVKCDQKDWSCNARWGRWARENEERLCMSTGMRSISATQKWSEKRRWGGNVQQGTNGVLAERYNNTSGVEKGEMIAGKTAATPALLEKNELQPGRFVMEAMMFFSVHRGAMGYGNRGMEERNEIERKTNCGLKKEGSKVTKKIQRINRDVTVWTHTVKRGNSHIFSAATSPTSINSVVRMVNLLKRQFICSSFVACSYGSQSRQVRYCHIIDCSKLLCLRMRIVFLSCCVRANLGSLKDRLWEDVGGSLGSRIVVGKEPAAKQKKTWQANCHVRWYLWLPTPSLKGPRFFYAPSSHSFCRPTKRSQLSHEACILCPALILSS